MEIFKVSKEEKAQLLLEQVKDPEKLKDVIIKLCDTVENLYDHINAINKRYKDDFTLDGDGRMRFK